MLKKQKIFLVLFLVLVAIVLIPNIVNAAETYTGETVVNGETIKWQYNLNESNQIVNLTCPDKNKLSGSVTIPTTINEKQVIEIGSDAFFSAKEITSIVIPNSVIKIGGKAFAECTNLNSVNLGSIENIAFGAFENCTSLTSIKFPKTLKDAGLSPMFKGCTNLKTITFEEGITVIPTYLCAETPVESITIPSSVIKIEYNAFSGCKNLKNVDLGSIQTISFDVFEDCVSLTSITIPKTLKNGPTNPVFTGCTNLKTITFEEGITVIPTYLCAETPIESITIPSSVTEIKYNAFSGCKNLKNVDLGSIQSISFDVFENCTSLESITIPKTLKNGPVDPVFSGCTNLKTIILEEGLRVIPTNLCAETPIESIVVPNSVEKIEYDAFNNCTNLKKITILDNCKKIGWENEGKDTSGVFENHNKDLTIYCYEGSEAASYAIRNDIKYVYIKRVENEDTNDEDKQEDTKNEEQVKPGDFQKPTNNKPEQKPQVEQKPTNNNSVNNDSTKATGSLPYTGGEFIIILSAIAIVGLGIYLYRKNKDLRGI